MLETRAGEKGRHERRSERPDVAETEKREAPLPPCFSQRVRKSLMQMELRKYTFSKSAQLLENKGLQKCGFGSKSERVRKSLKEKELDNASKAVC